MASFYGIKPGYPMSDENAQILYDDAKKEMLMLEQKLKEHE